jgi:hypothetical protein
LQAFGVAIDIRQIRRADSSLSSLSDCLFDLSAFTEGLLFSERTKVSTGPSHRCDANFPIVVKSVDLSTGSDHDHIKRSIETLVNLRHLCIAGPVGFVVLSQLQAVKIVRSYVFSGSLSDLI